jgi:mannose-6-phosphate isomerase class I
MFELKNPQEFHTHPQSGKNSVQIMVALEGCGIVEAPGVEPVTLTKGEAVVVPACAGEFCVRPQWAVEFLKAALPSGPQPEPTTRM